MPNLGTGELLILAVVILVLFGAKKLPDAARSMGRSLRIFKAETKGLMTDEQAADQQDDARERAAKLRAEADLLEGRQPAAPQQQAQLPAAKGDGTTLNGVPLPDADRARNNH